MNNAYLLTLVDSVAKVKKLSRNVYFKARIYADCFNTVSMYYITQDFNFIQQVRVLLPSTTLILHVDKCECSQICLQSSFA